MLEKLRLTPRQWKNVAKWSLYALLFLVVMLIQTVTLGNVYIFGTGLSLLPIVCCCICLTESAGNGGIFVLFASTLWCLSGADLGSVWVLLWTVLSVLTAIFCRVLLNDRILSGAVCCFVMLLCCESLGFLVKRLLEHIAGIYYLTKVLPCVVLSMLCYPLIYWVVRSIARIGGTYGT